MPKVYITKQEKLNNNLSAWIYGQAKVMGVSQEQMAKAIGISQPSLNRKLKLGRFTFQDLTAVFAILEPDGEELMKLMGVK